MADITLEIIDGSDLTETEDGYQATRVAKVTGLEGTPPTPRTCGAPSTPAERAGFPVPGCAG